MSSVWEDFKAWGKRPFSADMDALHWFYFLGLMVVLLALWRIVLNHITES